MWKSGLRPRYSQKRYIKTQLPLQCLKYKVNEVLSEFHLVDMMAVKLVWCAARQGYPERKFSAIVIIPTAQIHKIFYEEKNLYQITGCVIKMVARLLTTTYLEVTVSMADKLFLKLLTKGLYSS
jgi:hypothetical protein